MLLVKTQSIPCPEAGCDGQIELNVESLLNGQKSTCPVCGISVGLNISSKEDALNELNKLKKMKSNN